MLSLTYNKANRFVFGYPCLSRFSGKGQSEYFFKRLLRYESEFFNLCLDELNQTCTHQDILVRLSTWIKNDSTCWDYRTIRILMAWPKLTDFLRMARRTFKAFDWDLDARTRANSYGETKYLKTSFYETVGFFSHYLSTKKSTKIFFHLIPFYKLKTFD